MPRFSIARPSKIYPNWDVWFENKPSGNPGQNSDIFFDLFGKRNTNKAVGPI
jgi:hypothetical protein